ncbi:MAG: outer membrane protein assembly factor BamE domain-containing protein [Pyrinomonadaceae bacterium]
MDLTYWLLTLLLLERTAQIKEGMTEQEVVAVLGKPHGFQRSGEYETLRYTTRRSGRAREKTGFSVIFKDGRVVEYGAHYSKAARS